MSANQNQATPAVAPTAPAFSQVVRKGPIVQVAGQGPYDAAQGGWVHTGDVRAQTQFVLSRIQELLASVDATVNDLVMIRVYLADRADMAAMNEAYSEFIREHCTNGFPPARTTIIAGLPADEMLVEIDAMASLDQ